MPRLLPLALLISLVATLHLSCFRSGFAPAKERDVGPPDTTSSDGDSDIDEDRDDDSAGDADQDPADGDADADLDADQDTDLVNDADVEVDMDLDEETAGDGDADHEADAELDGETDDDVEADAEVDAEADEDEGDPPIVVTGDTCIDATSVAGGGLLHGECLEILVDTSTATNDYSMGSTDCATQPDVVISFDRVEPGASRSFSCEGTGRIDVAFDDFMEPTCPPEFGTYVFNLDCGGAPQIPFLRGGDYPTIICRDGSLPPATLWYCRGF